MARRSYEFDILAKVDQAVKAVNGLADGAQKQLGSINLNTSISALKDGFDIVSGVAKTTFGIVKGAIAEVTAESIEAEKAQFAMANALRLSGEFSAKAAGDFNDLAKAIQDSTVFTDDAVLASVGLAKQYGLTNAEATKTIKVAQDLAAATGDTLQGATLRLAQTFNGFVDKDLGKMNPALRNLSLESLNAGKALDLIRPAVEGTAKAFNNTFGAQLSNITKNFGEILETLGGFITGNAAIRESLKLVNDALKSVNDSLGKNGDAIRDMVTNAFVFLIQMMPLVVKAFAAADSSIATLTASTKAFILLATRLPNALLQAVTGTTSALDQLKKDLVSIDDAVKASERYDVLFKPLIDQSEKLAAGVTKVARETKGAVDAVNQLSTAGQGKGGGLAARGLDPEELSRYSLQVSRLKDQFDDLIRTKVQGLADRPLQGFITFLIKGQEEIDKTKREIDSAIKEIISSKRIPDALKQQAIGFAESAKVELTRGLKNEVIPALLGNVVSAVKKGAAGAAEAVASIVGGIVDAYFPGLGKIVKEIIEFLSLGPDEVKRLVTEFQLAVPKVVENILTSIPALIEQVIKNVPRVIEKIIEMLPRIIIAFIKGIPQIITAFVNSIPEVIQAFIKGIPQIISELVKAAPDIAKAIIDAIFQLAKGDAIPGGQLFGGGGGGGIGGIVGDIVGGIGDFFGGIGDVFGFAKGGRIPDLARFRGDGFGPVMLSAGEQVLNRDLTRDLERALQEGLGGGDVHVTSILKFNEQELARALFTVNRGGFRTA